MTKKDTIIALGNTGFHRSMANHQTAMEQASQLPLTLFCIGGGPDLHPDEAAQYEKHRYWNEVVYVQPEYTSILFAKQGDLYSIEGRRALVIGGGSSGSPNDRTLMRRLHYDYEVQSGTFCIVL